MIYRSIINVFLLPCIFLLFGAARAVAADDATMTQHFSLKNTHIVQLPSKQTGKVHELIISLPDSYQQSPNKKYPVLYFMDAYWDMPLLTAIYFGLVYDQLAPEFIMVGFSYAGDRVDYGQERLRDLTPTHVKDLGGGGAQNFLQFIKESVVPMIEKNYQVDPNQRALSGSSLGGLFTVHAMYDDPEFFKRYIAISPAAEWDNNYMATLDNAYAKKHKELNARLFLSYSTAEYSRFGDPIAAFQKQIQQRKYEKIQLLNYVMHDVRHAGVKPDGYVRGLMWGWKDIAPKGPSGLEQADKGR